MVNGNRWGVAAVVAALALGTPALAQSGSQMGTGGQRDPGSGAARGSDTSSGSSEGSSGSSTSMGSGTGTGSATSTGSGSSKVDKDLTETIQKLHAANQAEIQMGEMGEQMGTSQEVKDYAKKIAEDHRKNDQKLTTLAESLSVDPSGKAFQDEQKRAQKEMDRLHGKSGASFDKAYMSMMVKDHKKDVKDVQKASEEARKANQPELASYLAATQKGLTGHLQSAQRIEKDLKSGKSTASSSTGAESSGTGSSEPSSMGTGSSQNPNPSGGAIGPGGGSGGETNPSASPSTGAESGGTGSSSTGTGSTGSMGTGSSENPNPSGGATSPGGGSGGNITR